MEVIYKADLCFHSQITSKLKMKSIVLAALLGTLVFAEPTLKQKLGQSKKLAQVQQVACTDVEAEAASLPNLAVDEPDLAFCTCNDLSLPGLGAGVQASNSLYASVNQQTSIQSTPDVSQTSEALTESCACNEAQGEERVNAQRVRHFCIAGDVSVTETISYHQLQHAQEASAGRADKNSTIVLNNQGSEDLGDICIEGVSACPDNGISGGAPGTH